MMKPVPASAAVVGLLVKSTSLSLPNRIWPRLLKSMNSLWLPLRQIDRLEDENVRRVLDHAARVARRELDVGDERVSWIARVELAKGGATELLVLADGSEGDGLPNVGDCDRAESMTILVMRASLKAGISNSAMNSQRIVVCFII